jgi:serine/threonine-protein kinase
MMTADGVKVFDFGIAASIGSPDVDGEGGDIIGTPHYVAPERVAGGPVTAATDVFAVGVMLYRLLTGGYPWTTGPVEALVLSHLEREPLPLPALEGVPDAVPDLYRRALGRDPDERPSARELAATLAEAAGAPIQVGPQPLPVVAAEDRTAVVAPAGRPRRLLVLAGAGAAVVLVAAAAFAAPALAPSAEPGTPPWPAASPAVPPGLLALPADDRPATAIPTTEAPPASGPTTMPTGEAPEPVPPGPGPTTDQGPPPAPTTGGPTTFRTEGGSATATCAGNQATLVDWTATDGYRVERVNPGPARVVTVEFRRGSQISRLSIGCVDGVPVRST